MAATQPHPTGAPRIESWRVVTVGGPGRPTRADALVRVVDGDARVLVNGEGSGSQEALADAWGTAARRLHVVPVELSTAAEDAEVAELTVRAVHTNGVLSRLVTLLNTHEVSDFRYSTDLDGSGATAVLRVHGGAWQHERATQRLRRAVDVLEVTCTARW